MCADALQRRIIPVVRNYNPDFITPYLQCHRLYSNYSVQVIGNKWIEPTRYLLSTYHQYLRNSKYDFKYQNNTSQITILIWKTEPSLGRWRIFGTVGAFSFCNLRVIVSNMSCWIWNRLDFMLYKCVLFCELNLL